MSHAHRGPLVATGGRARGARRPGFLAAAVAVAAAFSLVPTVAAAQESGRGLGNACPEGVPEAAFTDVDGNVHGEAIDCLTLYRITTGTSESTFGPGGTVRRDQMASFVVRLLGVAGIIAPQQTTAPFSDVDPGNVHAQAIGQLAAMGVVGGYPDGTYRPGARVRRDQMAAFLNRAFAEVAGDPLLSRQRFYTDTAGNVHEDDINAVTAVGVAVGPGDGTFRPAERVRRDQMASFVMRLVDVLAAEGLLFTSVFLVTLDGYLVVDDDDPRAVRLAQGDPSALGYAFLGLHSGTGRLCYEVAIHADGPFTGTHIVRAAMDSTGPTHVELEPPDGESGMADGCILVDTAVLREIEASPTSFAVDVRSPDFPRGLARGQVDTLHREVTMSGAFVADDTGESVRFGQGQPDASGIAVLQADTTNGLLCGYVATGAAGPFLGTSIHRGAMDVSGPRVLELPRPDATGEAGGCVEADPGLLSEIVANSSAFYARVSTRSHPAGAVRGQLDTGTLGIPLSGEHVVDEDGQPGQGQPGATGRAWLQADFVSGLTCYWLTTNATGPFTGSHIIRAGAGENGPAVVTLAPPDDATGQVSGCQEIDPDFLAETAYVERFSFVIETESYPQGAVRGHFIDGLLR